MIRGLIVTTAVFMALMTAGCKERTPVAEGGASAPEAHEPNGVMESREGPPAADVVERTATATSVSAAGEAEKGIATNYRDLPEGPRGQLEAQLHTDDLSSLTNQSLDVLRGYFESKVLGAANPINRSVDTNYFWYVYNALPEFVDSRERHHGYYRGENEQPARERLLAYAIYRLDRSPGNLKRLFEMVEPRLQELFPASVYDRNGIRQIVDQLVSVHEAVSGVEGYREKLSGFYAEFYTPTGAMRVDENDAIASAYGGAYGFSTWELATLLSERLGIDRHAPYHGSPYLSFWMRRNAEGNIDEVIRILKEIQAVYE